MTKTKCITHPPRQSLVIIREDYLAICDGNHCAAAILNIFEYWTDNKLDNCEQAAIENAIATEGNAPLVNADLWIYKSIPELKAELLGLFGDSKISAALDVIKDLGILESRNNPKYGWDRTLQYQFNIKVAQALISRLGASVKNKASKASKVRHGSRKIKAAIPKTTTEDTSKIDSATRVIFQAIGLGVFSVSEFKGLSPASLKRIGALEKIARQLVKSRYSDATDSFIADTIMRFSNTEKFKPAIQGNSGFELKFAAYLQTQPPPQIAPPPPPQEQPRILSPEETAARVSEYNRIMNMLLTDMVEKTVEAA